MVQLVCHCLNVCIHTKNSVIQTTPTKSLALTNEETSHQFFQCDVATVTLDLGGITTAQEILITRCHVGDWIVYSCAGCGLNTHATHTKQKTEHILINMDMNDESNLKTKLTDMENYSLVFKIILPELNDNCFDMKSDVKFQVRSGKIDTALSSIQKQVALYLQQEHKAMEERIRIFTQQQQSKFATLQKKVRRDKYAMLSLLQKQQERDLKESLGEAVCENNYSSSLMLTNDNALMQESTTTKICNGQLDPFQSDSFKLPQTQIEVNTRNPSYNRSQSFDIAHHSSGKKAVKSVLLKRRKLLSLDADTGGIFDMEGLEQEFNNTPFYNSDYEDDTDDSSTTEENSSHFRNNFPKQFAQSLPINVPVWSQFNHSSGSEEEEKFVVTGDPEQIAASIKALTITDGTEMFGDLPRRRLNTGDLVKSRPL